MAPNDLGPPPENVRAHLLWDEAKGVIYVDRNHATNPLIVTWIERRRRGNPLDAPPIMVRPVDATELAKLLAQHKAETDTHALDDEEDQFKRRVRDMICRAAEYGASDVHIQVRQSDTVVHFVVGGESRMAESLTPQEGSRMLKTIYQGLSPNADSSYLSANFQNAQIPGDVFPASSELISVRIVKGPCYPQDRSGEFMTLRLQYVGGHRKSKRTDTLPYPAPPSGEFQLAKMGFTPEQIRKLDHLMSAPTGMVLVVGPTGSGKTTTIYEILAETQRRKPYKRLVTVEDPVEIPIETAVQLSVTNARDKESTAEAYQSAVRTMLRMAPKIIFVGELRDEEVASTALEASITGHAVISTLHVDEAFQWVDRLETMGTGKLRRATFCDPKRVRGIITQRIVSYVCPDCSVIVRENLDVLSSHKLVMEALQTWGDTSKVRVRGKGCRACQYSGISGRYALAEVIVSDEPLMHDFVHEGTATARRNYRARPGADKSMLDRAIEMVLEGRIDPISVENDVDVIPYRNQGPARESVREADFCLTESMAEILLEEAS
jgi:type II secretory ATPase GspE/PulE/Tfp pilus assembly ATPase PilB-like protein